MASLPSARSGRCTLARLPGEVEQVFTHFALRLTVYAAEFDGGGPDRLFLDPAGRGRGGGVLKHDAEGGRARSRANVTRAGRLLWKGQVVAASLARHLSRDGA